MSLERDWQKRPENGQRSAHNDIKQMNKMYKSDIKDGLRSENPEVFLRKFALELFSKGFSKKEIFNIFHEYYKDILDDESEQSNVDVLGDVMDMIWGTYSGKNIDFEHESC